MGTCHSTCCGAVSQPPPQDAGVYRIASTAVRLPSMTPPGCRVHCRVSERHPRASAPLGRCGRLCHGVNRRMLHRRATAVLSMTPCARFEQILTAIVTRRHHSCEESCHALGAPTSNTPGTRSVNCFCVTKFSFIHSPLRTGMRSISSSAPPTYARWRGCRQGGLV